MFRRSVFLGTLILAACSSPEAKKPVKSPIAGASSAPKEEAAVTPPGEKRNRPLNESPNGDVATVVYSANVVKIVDKNKATRELAPDTLHPPPAEKGLIGITAQTVTYLDDGTLLVGVGDGTVVALDENDKPKWFIGFRGAITGIVPANENRVIVTTQRGVIALLDSTTGSVLWEKHPVSGGLVPAVFGADRRVYALGPRGVLAYSLDGNLVYSHALTLPDDVCCQRGKEKATFEADASGHLTGQGIDIRFEDPHPPIADPTPVYQFEYEKVLDEKVLGLLSTGPDELLLLTNAKKGYELVRYSGGTTKRFAIPFWASKAERVGENEKLTKLPLVIDAIAQGPNGNVWLVARTIFPAWDPEYPWVQRACKATILELVGTTVRERNDLQATFDEHWVNSSDSSRIQSTPEGQAKIFCFGEDEHVCAIYNGAQPAIVKHETKIKAIQVVGKNTYLVPIKGPVERLEDGRFITIPTPEDAYGIATVSGTSDDDLWFTSDGGYSAHHWNGKNFTLTSFPAYTTSGIVARSPTDAWTRDGQMHWDGKRWSLIADAQHAMGMVLRPSGETWAGNETGLFRVKPTARPAIQLPAAKIVDTKPLPKPESLTIGAPQKGYKSTKTSLVIKNAPAVSSAKRAEVARDGTLWIEAWDKLVEVDGQGNTTVLDKDEKRITFDRWFYPEGPGRGLFTHRVRESEQYNDRDELRRLEAGKSAKTAFQLQGHDVVAIAGNAQGATWIIGSVEGRSPYFLQKPNPHELGVHALVRPDESSSFQAVLGLPAVAYRDIAVTPEGGAFFIGALTQATTGEGVIIHARGRMGTEAVVRYRVQAALLSVAAVSNDEAWAVGAMGLVVHIKGNVIERKTIPSQAWLRAVVANGPNDVWIGGDDGTLLHYDGQSFHPVDQPLGPRAAFSGLAISRGVVWATSPSGIVRITK